MVGGFIYFNLGAPSFFQYLPCAQNSTSMMFHARRLWHWPSFSMFEIPMSGLDQGLGFKVVGFVLMLPSIYNNDAKQACIHKPPPPGTC
jgi:hypothetical protein